MSRVILTAPRHAKLATLRVVFDETDRVWRWTVCVDFRTVNGRALTQEAAWEAVRACVARMDSEVPHAASVCVGRQLQA